MLELKARLERLAGRIPSKEILTFAKFLLFTAVILPILPRHEFGRFHINPFKTWLVVVAVSSISYASYVLQKLTKQRGGVVLAALLGGAYSSTVTTIVISRRAAREEHPHLFSGSLLVASGVMYLRLAALIALFNRLLAATLTLEFLALAGFAIAVGWFWSKKRDVGSPMKREFEPKNPLDLLAAFLFAFLFLVMLGVDAVAAVMGGMDADPFVMGMAQTAGVLTPLKSAAAAVLIAAASNNLAKGIYAYILAGQKTRIPSLCLLGALAGLGLLPLLWL